MAQLGDMDLLACRLPQLQAAMYWTPLVCCIAGRIFLPGTRSSSGSSCTRQQLLYTLQYSFVDTACMIIPNLDPTYQIIPENPKTQTRPYREVTKQ